MSLGARSLAETACKHRAEQGEGLTSPGKCYGCLEEAEITFGSPKQSRLCGRGGSTFIHALFIKYFGGPAVCQEIRSKATKMNKIPACSGTNGCVSTDINDSNMVCSKYQVQ